MSATAHRIAFLTDIHANVLALEAVLADLRREAPDLVVAGGDLTFKFSRPRETLELLGSVDHLAIAGNSESYVTRWAEPGNWPAFLPAHGVAHARWTREAIGESWARRLERLPDRLSLSIGGPDDVLVVHGVPGDPFFGVHAAPGDGQTAPRWSTPDAILDERFAGVRAQLILCGHTHVPLVRRWRDALLVNPGAVGHGWPGTPGPELARYALLTYRRDRGWSARLRAVAYDHLRAAADLEAVPTGFAQSRRLASILRGSAS